MLLNKAFFFKLLFLFCIIQLKSLAQSNITIEVPPEYIGGEQQLNTDIRRYLVYPEDAKSRNISGNVIVEFEVDSNGKVLNSSVIEGIIPSMDSAAINVINFLDNWKPGTINGVPVKSTIKLPILFRLYQSNYYNHEQNEALKQLVKFQSKIVQYLGQDSIEQVKNILIEFHKTPLKKYYQLIELPDQILLWLILENYDEAANLLREFKDWETTRIVSISEKDLFQAIDIYLKNNYQRVIQNLENASIPIDLKKGLQLIIKNDQLQRFPDGDKIELIRGKQFDKSYIEKSSKLGYEYLKSAKDTSYNDYVRKIIVAENRYKYFSAGFGLGYCKIIHNQLNKKIYSNPQGFNTHFDMYYKRIWLGLVSNLAQSKNYEKIKIDTFNLKPGTKLGNTYIQIGLGYRFYMTDLFHFVPYFSYNFFDVNYEYEITKEKSITKYKNFETNVAVGFTVNFSFIKNKSANYKPANYTPLGLSFKYGQIIPNSDFQLKSMSHFFSLSFVFLFIAPKNERVNQNYFMYR
jgi:TonB family protein